MVKNEDVALAFVKGRKATGFSMFTDGKIIYSWGNHFPIAYKIGYGKYLFNVDKYSKSTSKHQTYVQRAISNSDITVCDTQQIKNAISDAEQGNPIVLIKTEEYQTITECFDRIKEIIKDKGFRGYNIVGKAKEMVDSWLVVKAL
jgi:hypothetical protein